LPSETNDRIFCDDQALGHRPGKLVPNSQDGIEPAIIEMAGLQWWQSV
jgi:hypothetical protein